MPALTSAGAVPRRAEVAAPASAATVLAHRFVSLAVLCGVPVLVVTADVLADGPLRHLDLLLETGSWHRSEPSLVSAASVFDRLGQRAVAGAVLVAVAAFLAWRGRSWRPLVVTGAALAVLNLVVGAMKLAVGRSKPLSGHDLLYVGGSQFPSGHAANAVVSWGLLVYLVVAYGRGRAPARLLVAAAGVTHRRRLRVLALPGLPLAVGPGRRRRAGRGSAGARAGLGPDPGRPGTGRGAGRRRDRSRDALRGSHVLRGRAVDQVRARRGSTGLTARDQTSATLSAVDADRTVARLALRAAQAGSAVDLLACTGAAHRALEPFGSVLACDLGVSEPWSVQVSLTGPAIMHGPKLPVPAELDAALAWARERSAGRGYLLGLPDPVRSSVRPRAVRARGRRPAAGAGAGPGGGRLAGAGRRDRSRRRTTQRPGRAAVGVRRLDAGRRAGCGAGRRR